MTDVLMTKKQWLEVIKKIEISSGLGHTDAEALKHVKDVFGIDVKISDHVPDGQMITMSGGAFPTMPTFPSIKKNKIPNEDVDALLTKGLKFFEEKLGADALGSYTPKPQVHVHHVRLVYDFTLLGKKLLAYQNYYINDEMFHIIDKNFPPGLFDYHAEVMVSEENMEIMNQIISQKLPEPKDIIIGLNEVIDASEVFQPIEAKDENEGLVAEWHEEEDMIIDIAICAFLGICWHKWIVNPLTKSIKAGKQTLDNFKCDECGLEIFQVDIHKVEDGKYQPDLTTWEGTGKILDALKSNHTLMRDIIIKTGIGMTVEVSKGNEELLIDMDYMNPTMIHKAVWTYIITEPYANKYEAIKDLAPDYVG